MPNNEEYEFPISPAQARLLVLDRMNPGTAQYNVPVAFAIRGDFAPEIFERCLDTLVARHESVRTVFRVVDGEQVQVVRARGRAGIRHVAPVAAADVAELLVAEASRPFDLSAGPLLRCAIFGVDDGSYRLVLTAHHVVCDGWSLRIMLNELTELYRAAADGIAQVPPEPSIQYPDYAAWQRSRLDGSEYTEQIRYWAERLRDAPALLELPTDLPRPRVRSAAGAFERVELSAETLARLSRVGSECGATTYETLFSAFTVFLGRLTAERDLVIGTVTAGRDHSDLQDMVGMLVNTLALRTDLAGDPSFREVLARTRELMLDARRHQDAPFEAVVEAVAPARELCHDPVVQVAFGFYDDVDTSLALPGARVEPVELILPVAKFDFMLYAERVGSGIAARFEYRTDLLTAATVRRWARNFTTLLDGLLARPDALVWTVDILRADERRMILEDWNATGVAVPDRPVPDLIAERAATTPDATAVVCGEVVLSYRELLTRADRLAADLCRAGVGPETTVGLCLPRSVEMAVAVVAVWRAGGAFVPLDPGNPRARIDHMAAVSGVRLIVAAAATESLVSGAGVPVLLLDRPSAARLPEPVPCAVRPGQRNLAYVLFTSGSTGTPKGVAVEHGSLTNLAVAVRQRFPVTGDDRVLQFTSFGFDATVGDLAFALAAGAELHIAAESERLGEELFARLRDSAISYTFLPPVAALSLPHARGALPELRTLAVGGEAFPAELLERWASDRRVLNVYGPTECTVFAITAALSPGQVPVIGRPVPNTGVYVLDSRLAPVPVGAPGEVYLTGAGLGRGYANRPGLTAERFVACPFGPPGARMYRTGDVARYRADGTIDYVGRADSQVQLRGFRIELGEIETALASHPGVAATAAAVRADDPHGDLAQRRLVAYVVPAAAWPGDATLRAWLAERLPGYMIPEVFVPLPALPTNGSGKIDRARLPAPPAARPDLVNGYLAPRTSTERWIAAIWARVLHVDQVGVHDNFFDLGGNSVRILSVQAALRERDDVSLVDLFRYPTVATLAAHLAEETPPDPGEAVRRGLGRRRRLVAARRARKVADR